MSRPPLLCEEGNVAHYNSCAQLRFNYNHAMPNIRILTFAAATVVGLLIVPALAQDPNQSWVTAWGTSQQALGELKITNATARMIARVTIPGDSIRIRLDN